MQNSESTVSPNTVEIRGLVRHYAATLEARGYRSSVVGAYSAAVEHFISWAAPDIARLEINKAAVRRFLSEHLCDCKCQGRVQRGEVTARAALNRLLDMFSGLGLWVPEVKFPTHVDAELRGFCGYANEVCGLAPATLVSRRQWIGLFLTDQFPKDRVEFSRLRPKHIRDFFTRQCQRFRPGTAGGRRLCSKLPSVSRSATCRPGRAPACGSSVGCALASGSVARLSGGRRNHHADGCVRSKATTTPAR